MTSNMKVREIERYEVWEVWSDGEMIFIEGGFDTKEDAQQFIDDDCEEGDFEIQSVKASIEYDESLEYADYCYDRMVDDGF